MYYSTFEMEQIRNGSDLTNTQIRQKQVTMNDLFYLLDCANITFCVFCLRNRFLCKKNNINPIQSAKMAIITNINLKRSDNKSKMV